jgi:hypothetical protein
LRNWKIPLEEGGDAVDDKIPLLALEAREIEAADDFVMLETLNVDEANIVEDAGEGCDVREGLELLADVEESLNDPED